MAPLQRNDGATLLEYPPVTVGLESTPSFGSTTSATFSATTESPIHKEDQDNTEDGTKSSSSQKKQLRSVRFSEYSVMYMVPGRDELKQQERRNAYYNETDYNRMRFDNELTLRAMERGRYPDTSTETFRGLESSMPSLYVEKKRMIAITVAAVLREQRDHKGSLRDSWIHGFYSRLNLHSAMNAARVGLYDADVALKLQK